MPLATQATFINLDLKAVTKLKYHWRFCNRELLSAVSKSFAGTIAEILHDMFARWWVIDISFKSLRVAFASKDIQCCNVSMYSMLIPKRRILLVDRVSREYYKLLTILEGNARYIARRFNDRANFKISTYQRLFTRYSSFSSDIPSILKLFTRLVESRERSKTHFLGALN